MDASSYGYTKTRIALCVGSGYRANIAAKLGNDRKIEVVTNGVDLDVLVPRPRDARWIASLGITSSFVCSYVGTIGMAHALDVVVRAAERLRARGCRDIAFIMVGDGAERKSLEKMVLAKGLQHFIKFTGRVSRDEAVTALASSDACLVHLRKTELFSTVLPSKLFEAMAMECPIIMGVLGEARDIVLGAGAGIPIEPENDEELANVLIMLAENPERVHAMKARARQLVVDRYNRDVLAEKYLRLIEGAGSQGSRR